MDKRSDHDSECSFADDDHGKQLNELSTESLTVLCMRRYLSSDAKKLINRNGEKLIV